MQCGLHCWADRIAEMDIISPLVYCQLRDEQGEVCDTFSSAIVEGLPCCSRCAEKLIRALDENGVVLVTRMDALDKKEEV